MLLIQFRKKQEMDTPTGFWGQTTGDRKHRYIGKHTYGIKIRDLVRKTAFGINFSVIGIENHKTTSHYTFPVRAMSYDVGEYERQLKCIRRRLRRKGKDGQHLTAAEYLCGFQKDIRLYPVVTFVLYYGKDEWDAATDLHGMLDFIRCSKDDERYAAVNDEDPEYGKMEEDAYNMAAAYTGTENLLAVKDDYIEGGRVNMCKAIDDLILKGKLEGRVEGVRKEL